MQINDNDENHEIINWYLLYKMFISTSLDFKCIGKFSLLLTYWYWKAIYPYFTE